MADITRTYDNMAGLCTSCRATFNGQIIIMLQKSKGLISKVEGTALGSELITKLTQHTSELGHSRFVLSREVHGLPVVDLNIYSDGIANIVVTEREFRKEILAEIEAEEKGPSRER